MAPLASDLIGVHLPAEQANLLGDVIATQAGIGTTQALGAGIPTQQTITIATATGGATAFRLPSGASLAVSYQFTNSSATTALLFPPVGGSINGGSTDASISVPQNVTVELTRVSATSWRGEVSAGGSGSFTSLAVSGNATVGGTLGVTGAATLGSAVVTAGATVGTTLGVTGLATFANATATPANGSAAASIRLGTTATLGIYYGAGAPTGLTAGWGSLYLNTTGNSTSTRAYINSDGGTTWIAITTAT